MKRTLCIIAAILVTMVIYAQNDEAVRWSPEFSAKAYVSVYHGSYEITAGARINDNVIRLMSGRFQFMVSIVDTSLWDKKSVSCYLERQRLAESMCIKSVGISKRSKISKKRRTGN